MKKQIYWQEVLLKIVKNIFILSIYSLIFFTTSVVAKQKCIMDKILSSIFEFLKNYKDPENNNSFDQQNPNIQVVEKNGNVKKNNKIIRLCAASPRRQKFR